MVQTTLNKPHQLSSMPSLSQLRLHSLACASRALSQTLLRLAGNLQPKRVAHLPLTIALCAPGQQLTCVGWSTLPLAAINQSTTAMHKLCSDVQRSDALLPSQLLWYYPTLSCACVWPWARDLCLVPTRLCLPTYCDE